MTEIETASDKKSAIITIIGIASAAWLLVCGWLFWAAAPCDPAQVEWYSRKVSCLASNEMGDSLAGAFAPLAFLWLIAAVFLQRNELAAQRQELRLTREEFKLTRREVGAQRLAMQEQVLESRRNVAFVEEQTSILKAGRLQDEQNSADSRIKSLATIAKSQSYEAIVQTIARPVDFIENAGSRGMLPLVAQPDEAGNDIETVVNFTKSLHRELRWFPEAIKATRVEIRLNPEMLGGLQRTIGKIDELRKMASDELNDSLEYLEWWRVSLALEELERFLSSQDQGWAYRLAEWKAETPN